MKRDEVDFHGCERSVITMTLLQLSYLVHSPDNCAMTLSTETGLIAKHFITQSGVFMGQLARAIV